MKTYEVVYNTDFIMRIEAAEMTVEDGYAYFFTNDALVASATGWMLVRIA